MLNSVSLNRELLRGEQTLSQPSHECDRSFFRVALLTTVDEQDARDVLEQLADRRHAPESLVARMEYIRWEGEHKDLRNAPAVTLAEILFVDDDRGWVHPDQLDQWIPIDAWHGGEDNELSRVQQLLEKRLLENGCL